MKQIIKSNKDMVVLYLVILWSLSNLVCFCIFGETSLFYTNGAFVAIFLILLLLMNAVKGFDRWLDKDFWRKDK